MEPGDHLRVEVELLLEVGRVEVVGREPGDLDGGILGGNELFDLKMSNLGGRIQCELLFLVLKCWVP